MASGFDVVVWLSVGVPRCSRRRGLAWHWSSALGFGVGVRRWDQRQGTVLVRCWAWRRGLAWRGVWVQRRQAQEWGTDRRRGAAAGFGVRIWIGVVVWRRDWHQGLARRRGFALGFGLTSGFCVGLGVDVWIGVVVMRQGLVWRRGLVIGIGF